MLLENCSGGGARFDPGMLYYSPQIWCSDDTDAIERLAIQEGTALLYPLSCIGAHVSVCPNHAVGRVTPLETECVYRMNEKQYSSDVLMNCGIRICPANRDFVSNLFYLEKLT